MSESALPIPTPAKKYKDWTPDQPWPTDVPRRVKSTLTGNAVVFYKSQRVRSGQTFTLTKPQDYDPRSMGPLKAGHIVNPPTEIEARLAQHADHPKQIEKRAVAQSAPARSSAHLTMKAGATPVLDDGQEYTEVLPGLKNPNDVI